MKMLAPRVQKPVGGRLRPLTASGMVRPRGRRWMTLRAFVMTRDEYRCCACGVPGVGHEVDHVVPLEQGGAAWDAANLQTLCPTCHAAKTAAQAAGRGR